MKDFRLYSIIIRCVRLFIFYVIYYYYYLFFYYFSLQYMFDPNDVVEISTKIIPYLESEPMLIEDLPYDITIVGDLHGQVR